MSYQVILKPTAEKQLNRLPKSIQSRIVEKLSALQENPRLSGSSKLTGATSVWRVRVGDYRIVYEIHDDRQNVFVTIIAHRREVYRGL